MCIWVCGDPARRLASCKGCKARRALLQSARDGTRRLPERRTAAELYPRAAQGEGGGECTPILRRVSEKQNKTPVPRPCGSFPKKGRHAFGIDESRQSRSSFLSGLCGFPGQWVKRADSPGWACYLKAALTGGAAIRTRAVGSGRKPTVIHAWQGQGWPAADKTLRQALCLQRGRLFSPPPRLISLSLLHPTSRLPPKKLPLPVQILKTSSTISVWADSLLDGLYSATQKCLFY